MEIELRQFRHSDFKFAWELYEALMKRLTEELLPWREDKQKAVVQDAIDSGEGQIILVDGRMAGWLQIRRNDDRLYLGQIYITPECQGKGIATILVRQLIEEARANNKALTLSVMKNNRATTLYKRLGFRTETTDQYKYHMRWKQA